MLRERCTPRPDAKSKIEHLGLTFHTLDSGAYWDESVVYRFAYSEIELLENATNELHEMCLAAVDRLIVGHQLARLSIPEVAHTKIAQVWEDDPPAIYGRFDLAFDGRHPPKLLEYNADTPTSLLETAVIQWHWLQEVKPNCDQFNSIWEALVAKWQSLKCEGYLGSGWVHFACMDSMEDLMTTAVLMDTAREVGLEPRLMHMQEIGWDSLAGRFVDPDGRQIKTLFKLYPWEWILTDDFGPMALKSCSDLQWIEPLWKMVLSNKAILAILWEMYPDHPNLLPAYLDGPRDLDHYVRKPILGREGANIKILGPHGTVSETDGPYDESPWVFQAYTPLPVFAGNHAVIGSWVIDGEARGIGVRESAGPITEDHARFVPHYFEPMAAAALV